MIEMPCVECYMRSSVSDSVDTIWMHQCSILIICITEVVLANPERDGKRVQICKFNDVRHATPAVLREHATRAALDVPDCERNLCLQCCRESRHCNGSVQEGEDVARLHG